MRIAVTYDNGMVFQHFGRTEHFKLYDAEDGRITASRVIDTNGTGHGALAGLLRMVGADALICGGIGTGARNALEEAGIRLYPGVSGQADEAAAALAAGRLVYDIGACCGHHHDHDDGSCGNGHCADHGCAGTK